MNETTIKVISEGSQSVRPSSEVVGKIWIAVGALEDYLEGAASPVPEVVDQATRGSAGLSAT